MPTAWYPLLWTVLTDAGIVSAKLYSGHSLRRGFPNSATLNGWDLETLIAYVGWKRVQSALRHIDAVDSFVQQRIESTLPPRLAAPGP